MLGDVYYGMRLTHHGDGNEEIIEAKFLHNNTACDEAGCISVRSTAIELRHAPKHHEQDGDSILRHAHHIEQRPLVVRRVSRSVGPHFSKRFPDFV
jgi:hypothetical protein